MEQDHAKLRVAILGGGLAGVFLLRGLLKISHLDVHLYEARGDFSEDGAGIALSTNATSALGAIDPEIIDCLDRAGAAFPKETNRHIAQGPHAGKRLKSSLKPLETEDTVPMRTCARQQFLSQLLRQVPLYRLHCAKKLSTIDDDDAAQMSPRYRLCFEDGEESSFDIVVGADGVHSRMRDFVIGSDNVLSKPQAVGILSLPILIPYKSISGELQRHIDQKRQDQSSWLGSQSYILLDLHDDGSKVQIVALIRESGENGKAGLRKREMSQEEFRGKFSGMLPHLSSGAIDAICTNSPDPLSLWYVNDHLQTPTYVRGRTCIIGDAAHATSPSMASGGGMSAEDACILTALLAHVKTTREADAALKAYDKIRRPRCEQIIAASRRTGDVMCGGEGLDPDHLNSYLSSAWDFIQSWRPTPETERALRIYAEVLAAARRD